MGRKRGQRRHQHRVEKAGHRFALKLPPGGEIALAAEFTAGRLVVTVKDNGMGIAPDDMPHLFEIFSQSKPALQRAQGGLGIGLFLVKSLVQMHGGSVSAHSE